MTPSMPTRTPPAAHAPVHGSRQPRRMDYALKRLRESVLLRGSAVLAFMDYGGVIALLLANRLPFTFAGIIVFMSLASWVFLLAWFPVIEETIGSRNATGSRVWIGRTFEAFAIGSAVLVHVLMAAMIVIRARS